MACQPSLIDPRATPPTWVTLNVRGLDSADDQQVHHAPSSTEAVQRLPHGLSRTEAGASDEEPLGTMIGQALFQMATRLPRPNRLTASRPPS